MCLAVPMLVLNIRSGSGDLADPGIATVDAGGIRQEVRLELADRKPEVGDYVIVHAGFAIRTLTEQEARINLQLMREIAEHLAPENRNKQD